VSNFAFPWAKLSRGAAARRGMSGFWHTPWSTDQLTQAALAPESLLALDKAAWPELTPSLRRLKRRPTPVYGGPAVLDNEWVPFIKVPACLTPEPYEDLDQPFVHQHWTVEINTTRRSDHNSKYKVA